MNCRRIEKLLPLYVEGDLTLSITQRIESHLDWCGRCNWLADEYKESQNWLRTTEIPHFDEKFLNTIKSGVLSRIDETAAKPSLLASFVQHWTRRQVLALSTLLILIFAMLVFYVSQTRTIVNRSAVQTAQQTDNDKLVTETSKANYATEVAPGATVGGRTTATIVRKATRQNRPSSRRIDEAALLSRRVQELPSVRVQQTIYLPANKEVPRDMLRIEIQTSDPNIRIIWFAPRKADESPLIIN